jgi:hypothetical protein
VFGRDEGVVQHRSDKRIYGVKNRKTEEEKQQENHQPN